MPSAMSPTGERLHKAGPDFRDARMQLMAASLEELGHQTTRPQHSSRQSYDVAATTTKKEEYKPRV